MGSAKKTNNKYINSDANEPRSAVRNNIDSDNYDRIVESNIGLDTAVSSQRIHDSLQTLYELTVSSINLSQKQKEAIVELVLSLQSFVDGIEKQEIGQNNERPISIQVVRTIESIHNLITFSSSITTEEVDKDEPRNHYFHDLSVNLSPSISTRSFYDESIAVRMPFPTKTKENTQDSDSEFEDEL
ncbi:hypothetical protein G9P44_004432 [Scheffersomyces stipitis]|nr:hypothetical protein G9P44_004432 [Scheffersomyces stipitis]